MDSNVLIVAAATEVAATAIPVTREFCSKNFPMAETLSTFPLVDSWMYTVGLNAAYLTIVWAGYNLRKAFPRDRNVPDSFMLKSLVIVHNLILLLTSAFMFCGITYYAIAYGYEFSGNSFVATQTEMATMLYIFYISKYYEYVDTMIMLLKGNLNQISFLHVYHHSTISAIWWLISYTEPGGDAYFSAAFNSWIHVWMYLYYCMAAMLPKDPATKKKYLWWGRYLTQMQMVQFSVGLGHGVLTLYHGTFNKYINQVYLVYMVSLLALFGNFYVQKHLTPKIQHLTSKKAS